ncbi:MAG: hypothetical protein MUF54_16865 [Polyangiaceae bacterium]|nr:hypothetical protein [Polyangiaceae bacterium]
MELKEDRFRVTETARLAELPTDTPIVVGFDPGSHLTNTAAEVGCRNRAAFG